MFRNSCPNFNKYENSKKHLRASLLEPGTRTTKPPVLWYSNIQDLLLEELSERINIPTYHMNLAALCPAHVCCFTVYNCNCLGSILTGIIMSSCNRGASSGAKLGNGSVNPSSGMPVLSQSLAPTWIKYQPETAKHSREAKSYAKMDEVTVYMFFVFLFQR